MSRDIRMLTLYKQHYMDCYNEALDECQYSCWGYYDGMSIEPIKPSNSKLFEKRSSSPISDLWYHTAKNSAHLKAWYGEQNIGLFRCVPQEDDTICQNFWDRHDKMPYFSVAFLQLQNKTKYDSVRKILEDTYQQDEGSQQYNLLAYCTFDNADLVILLQGNSIKDMETILNNIEQFKQTAYLHPIMGISEKYLKESDLNVWNSLDCHTSDHIVEIEISISSSGRPEILRWIRAQLKESIQINPDNIEFSFVAGHKNLIVYIRDTTVKTILLFLKGGGFSTHQNLLYKNGVYNIETSIRIQRDPISCELPLTLERKSSSDKPQLQWCHNMIKKYSHHFGTWKTCGNESMYSYYHALLQTLNTLGQYENFKLADSIFIQLYPSFQMFLKQLDMALAQATQNNDSRMMEKIKESICQYLESVNSVMYHTTHTDQMFLMIPGCSGTTFSIPIKLSLLYSWFCDQVIYILNDSKKAYEYQCLITPVMESKPGTEPIGFGLGHGDRLVQVKLSQRSLYMPRSLMIILAHELAHYVGEDIRHRKYRLAEIIRALAALLIEGIIPGTSGNTDVSTQFNNTNRLKMQRYIITELQEKLRINCKANGYHASYIANELITGCKQILAEEETGLGRIIYEIPQEVWHIIHSDKEKRLQALKELRALQEECDRNRRILLITATDNLDLIVNDLIRICREVFSDTAAFTILDFEPDDFKETFDISEGVLNEEKYDQYQSIRKEVVLHLMSSRNKGQANAQYTTNTTESPSPARHPSDGINRNRAEMLRYNLFSYDCTKNLLKRYAEKCYYDLQARVKQMDTEKESIREIFKMFAGQDSSTCNQIFKAIYNRIDSYSKKVQSSLASREIPKAD